MTKIIVLNAGSSSLKFQLFEMPQEELIVKGLYEKINSDEGMLFSFSQQENKATFEINGNSHFDAINHLLDFLIAEDIVSSLDEIEAVGHRVAHGGEYFKQASIIGEKEVREIDQLSHLAPLHNPVNLIGIEAFIEILPMCPQVAVFDTSFHQTMAEKDYLYPIPYEYYTEHSIRRYGFHGTSHQYVAHQVAEVLGKKIEDLKIISCHLGNGASICGIKDGKSVMTSMGFTPLAGLMMGTRCGDIDPSILPFIQKEQGLSVNEINEMMNTKSGLLGVSGVSNDLREVEKAMSQGNPRAQLAHDIFTSRIRQTIGSYAAELGGVDALVFTAGIGENSPFTRMRSCEKLGFLGITLDDEQNQKNETVINRVDSPVDVLVIPTNEELMIAQETYQLLAE